MKKLFLLDGHALVYRAHFAFIKRPMLNSKGQNVSAVMGFFMSLFDILEKEKPSHIGVSFDLSGPTFRHERYPEYKANREEQPEDISWALPQLQVILQSLQIPIATAVGYEADDVIGTLAKQAEAEGFEVYMMTPDKDYGQLVSKNIFLYKPARMGNSLEKLGVEEICKSWGIERVEQVIDMLGLQGDSVDNIPGVRGIGPKTAQTLLADYGSVEGILENIDKLKERYQKLFSDSKDIALLSKELATIDVQAPVSFNADAYFWEFPNIEPTLKLFQELEFRSLRQRLIKLSGQQASQEQGSTDLFGNSIETEKSKKEVKPVSKQGLNLHTMETSEHEYILLETKEQVQDFVQQLKEQPIFCFDTETTGLEPMRDELVGIAFAWQKAKAYYLALPAQRSKAQEYIELLRPVFENGEQAKVGQNLKFDMLVLRNYGIELQGQIWDTMLIHYLLDPEGRHSMDYMSETLLGYKPMPIEALLGKRGKKQLSMRDIAPAKVKDYAAEDADITWQLYEHLLPQIQERPELLKLYQELEAPLVEVLVAMEFAGVYIDSQFLADYSKELQSEIQKLREAVYEEAGIRNFNLDSPKQVGEVLFEQLNLPYKGAKTKTGQYSTNEEKLSSLAGDYPIVAKLLEYRQLTKLQSTYVEALPLLVNSKTGRLHSSFNQALTTTGRLSSANPNLQNIPIRSAWGKEIRKAFVPAPGKDACLLAADYSQIELRLMAEMSGDAAMMEAFAEGQDIHRATAARIYKVALDEVTSEQRYQAKAINFSIIYGAGATNISQNLGISRKEAAALIEQYFAEYPGVKVYMDKAVEQAREQGYVETLLGRRRYLRDINSRNGMIRSHAERNAINSPIQGSAADMMKAAMIGVYKALRAGGFSARIILQVHDELLIELPKSELDALRPLVEEAMKKALPGIKVPIELGMDVGQNWLEAH